MNTSLEGTRFAKIALPFFMALVLTFSACAPAAETAQPSPSPSDPPTVTAAPKLPPPFPQVQTIHEMEVELLNARILDGQLTIDICHQMPTQEDWIVGSNPEGTFVTVGGEKINLSGFGILYYRASDNTGKNTHRCDALNFPVSDPNIGKMTLTINEFYTSVPEAPDCVAAQKKLNESGADIKFTCESVAYDTGGGSFGFTITQKPEGMSDDDARKAVDYAFSSHVKGPWEFEINLPTPLVETTSTPWPTPAGIEPMDDQLASVNGVDVLATGNGVDGALFQVDVCYIPPTKDSAWALAQSPKDITLEVAGQTYPVDQITYTGWENQYGFPHISERYRCHRLNFTVPEKSDTSQVTLHINKLYEFPMGSGCDKMDITFKAGKITNAACSSPLSELTGPWVIQTGLARR